MNKDRRRSQPLEAPPPGAAGGAALPYMVELWDLGRQAVEQVIGRAASRAVAESIFRAAIAAQPGRRVVLRRGESVLREN